MDDRKRKLINWVVEHRKQLELSIITYTWPQRWLSHLYDFKVSLHYNNEPYEGRGTDSDEETALVKAIMEAFERMLIKENNLENSSGIALHFDYESAKSNALAELIERDSFLCHFLTKTPGDNIDHCLSGTLKEFIAKTTNEKVQTHVLKLRSTNNHFVTMTIATGIKANNPFGLCLGLAADLDLDKAIWKSSIECARHVTSFLELDASDHSLFTMRDFLAIKKPDVVDHIRYANNPAIGNELFKQLTKENNASHSSTQAEVNFTELKMPKFMEEFKLSGIRAHSSELQDLFFGITTRDNIHLKRLKQFADQGIEFDHLNKLPHPLG